MINVLLLSDLHGNYEHIDRFIGLNPDMVLIAGDLTDCGPAEGAKDLLAKFEMPCFVVPGNCDPRDILDVIERSDAVCLHGSSIDIGAITFTGIGASNPTPFDTPFELSEEEIDELLVKAKKRMKQNVHNVLVAHAPPLETLDCIGDMHVGSSSMRAHMEDFDLVCCGHIHEEKGIRECGGVTVVNPGMASEGDCAFIHFGDAAKEFTIDLLTVSP
ncbi:MAG: metallophosphoesterase [Methanomicrobiaceae archaeon]|nr:metallophosphoesterase [Methanomicrobiaceae archaeon]